MTDRTENGNRYWHVGREIPVAMIITSVGMFLGQTVALVWFFATMSADVTQLKGAMAVAASQSERIVRLEEKIGVVQQGINEVKALLARLPK